MELLWAMIFPRPRTQWLASSSELAMRSRFFRWSLKTMEKQRYSGTSLAYFSIPSVLWPDLTSRISSMETVERKQSLLSAGVQSSLSLFGDGYSEITLFPFPATSPSHSRRIPFSFLPSTNFVAAESSNEKEQTEQENKHTKPLTPLLCSFPMSFI